MLRVRCSNHLRVLARDVAWAWVKPSAAPDQFLVQSLSQSAWLQRMLAADWGIAADLTMSLPQTWVKGLGGGDESAWCRDRLRWRLESAVPASMVPDEPLARHRLLAQIADAFDTWQIQRPEVLADWAGGGSRHDDGWLGEAWRTLKQQGAGPDRSEILRQLGQRIRSGTVALPPRLGVFAVSNLGPLWLEVFQAVAEHSEVTLWLWSPTPHPWADLPDQRELVRDRRRSLAKAMASAAQAKAAPIPVVPTISDQGGHPLLTRLGGQARRWFRALERLPLEQGWEALPFVAPERDTLLHHLQADVVDLVEPDASHIWRESDASLTFHDCPSRRRELEVLREAIAAAMREDPTLRPSEILVLLSDVAAYASLIPAVFGAELATTEGTVAALPWRIVDRSVAAADPLAAAVLAVIAVAGGRRTRSQIVGLLSLECVQAALHLDQDTVDQGVALIDRAGFRWGSDARARAELGGGSTGTWAAARDRLVAGWWLGPVDHPDLPVAGALAGDLDGPARILAWVDALQAVLDAGVQPRHLTQWVAWTRDLIQTLLVAPGEHGLAAMTVQACLDTVVEAAGDVDPVLEAAVWADHLGTVLEDAGVSRHPGMAGGITFSGLKPQRAIPATVIALLGLDETVFPRRIHPPRWDLLAQTPARSGDRDPRSEDRQLVLEALLAAGERLHISWVGHDPRTGAVRPPSGVVVAVQDAIVASLTPSSATAVLAAITTVEPRHAMGASADPLTVATAGLLSVPARQRQAAEPFAAESLPVSAMPMRWLWQLDALLAVLALPAQAFALHRLGVDARDQRGQAQDHEPLTLPALDQWSLADEHLAEELCAGEGLSRQRAVADGALPPGHLGDVFWESSAVRAQTLMERVRAHGGAGGAWHAARLLCSQAEIVGHLPPPGPDGVVLWALTKKVETHAKHNLRLWLHHLLWSATRSDDQPGATLILGEADSLRCPAMDAAHARLHLDRICALAERMCRELVPLPLDCGFTYFLTQDKADLEKVWGEADATNLWGKPPEAAQPSWRLAWRDMPARPWQSAEFPALVQALWQGYAAEGPPKPKRGKRP